MPFAAILRVAEVRQAGKADARERAAGAWDEVRDPV